MMTDVTAIIVTLHLSWATQTTVMDMVQQSPTDQVVQDLDLTVTTMGMRGDNFLIIEITMMIIMHPALDVTERGIGV